MGLLEPPSVGRRFTWTNGQADPIWVKLDRFLVNYNWLTCFPRVVQSCLPRLGSDHVPLRLEMGYHFFNPRPFRFELAWTTKVGFHELVHQWWSEISPRGCGAFILSKKIAGIRARLRHWAKHDFGSIKLQKLALLHDLEVMDLAKEERRLSSDEIRQESDLLDNLKIIHKQEEIYWKQRSRLQWLKEGDENTKFFHAVPNGRKNRNFIPRLLKDDVTFEHPKDIGRIFSEYFKLQFGQRRSNRFQVDLHKLFAHKSSVDLTDLERPFSLEEIKKAVFDLGGDKAPGPDGFPLHFFKHFWDIINPDLLLLCNDFFFHRANLERINWASIALIPKVDSPEALGDFRPISLINSSLKIISKLLASRLSKIINSLVSTEQSAFLKGRCILDNIATAEELIFSIHKRRLSGHILKVDFAKAFDLVDWDFLFDLLRARGFGERWIRWIMDILFSSKASILVNGSPNGYVRYHRGLRQGDPLSPLLFVLVTDALCAMFFHALRSKVLIGVPIGEVGSMCNLHYADDLLVLTTGGLEDLRMVKLILLVFEGMTGLAANFSKTCLYSSSMDMLPDQAAADTLSCSRGILPVTYLGIPISGRRPRRQDWEELIVKIRRRLSTWKVQFLSLGGRLTLVNSVLSAIPTYWMSLFHLPCWVVKKINRIRRDFLWSGPDIDHPKCRLVGWKNLCRSRDQGGWGILELHNFNSALLGIWWWKFLSDPTWCGANVVKFNYGLESWNLFPRPAGRISFFWKGVMSCLPSLRGCILQSVNSGTTTLFWKDRWVDGQAPMYIWPDEFRRTSSPDGTVCDLLPLFEETPFNANPVLADLRVRLRRPLGDLGDKKWWTLTGNGSFSVKSFYNFLNDGGLRCPVADFFWRQLCPKKINIFNWLAWKNKILSLENLARRCCNRLPTATCVLCHANLESVDHLFFQCSFARQVWNYFVQLLQLPDPPSTITSAWGNWRSLVRPARRVIGDSVVKAIVWNVWLSRNDYIFNTNCIPVNALIIKVAHMLLTWFTSAGEGSRDKLEDSITIIRRELGVLRSKGEASRVIASRGLTRAPSFGRVAWTLR
ncbi:uncharacterized protein LOC120263117 [Dioscorea cayenensis subsp. rotundata]|uniref:Uncharacterized protein LOC120263117 n=1 Tax=Dioscorea cayennensis subsp. rotundata TaxID=55577 RepID=A0AB40BHT8_DIOCR|nr:uncharacterized protein LOC120263117 [Dioscorea cayenensis subsp. rotundata]